jgi:dihydrodipicolinate synthase/N-acetylneuraminate lyase
MKQDTAVTGALNGVCPVLEVPFTAEGAVDEAGFGRMLAHVLASGVTAVMFPGFASEFHKLTVSERTNLRDQLLAVARDHGGVAAVVAVQDHATRLAVDSAVEAVEARASAVNLLPPHFLGPSRRAVHEHLSAVLTAVAPTPVVLQYAPAQVGAVLDVDAIAGLAAEHANLALVKVESAPPGRDVAQLLAGSPAVRSAVGYAGMHTIDALERGAVGVQPGCSFVEVYLRIWESWHDGDRERARVLHRRLLPYLTYFMTGIEPMVAMEKYISTRRGWFESDHCRAPGHGLDDHERALADRLLEEFSELLT